MDVDCPSDTILTYILNAQKGQNTAEFIIKSALGRSMRKL